jgi:phage gp37-like protein
VSYVLVQDEVYALAQTVPHVDFYRGQMSDEEFAKLVANSDSLKPFVTVSFGGKLKPRMGTNSITGAKHASYLVTIVVRAVASSERDSQLVLEEVEKRILGFMPTNSGEIEHALYGGTGQVSSLGNPTRYASVQAYSLMVNSDQV